jgi:hypothetical protein
MAISEEVILDRDRVQCIVNSLSRLLQVESHFEFKLRFGKRGNGEETLTIVPHATPVEIVLNRP